MLIKKLCDEQKWSIVSQEDDVLVANSDFSTWHKTKKITILFDRNKVFVNSIYDPDRNKAGGVIDLFGNNKEIIKIIIDRLQLTQKVPG